MSKRIISNIEDKINKTRADLSPEIKVININKNKINKYKVLNVLKGYLKFKITRNNKKNFDKYDPKTNLPPKKLETLKLTFSWYPNKFLPKKYWIEESKEIKSIKKIRINEKCFKNFLFFSIIKFMAIKKNKYLINVRELFKENNISEVKDERIDE